MKKIILICLMAFVGIGVSTAQNEVGKKKLETAVFTSTDIDCDHCVKKIMENVSVLGKGVKDVKTDVKQQQVTVVFDPSKNNVQRIAKGLESLNLKVAVIPVVVTKGEPDNSKGMVIAADKKQDDGTVHFKQGDPKAYCSKESCDKAATCESAKACCSKESCDKAATCESAKACCSKESCDKAGKCESAKACCSKESCDKAATCEPAKACCSKESCDKAGKCESAQKKCCSREVSAKK